MSPLADAGPSLAQSRLSREGCAELWLERNSVYAAAGYCFKTARGIRAFGNAGCRYDDVNEVPLSAREREVISHTLATERRYCPGNF